jgi:short-subunit dehydrogenase
MSQSLRFELRKWGVHVANVNPAFMKTPLIMSSIKAGIKDLTESKECCQYPDDVLDGTTSTVLAVCIYVSI